MQVISFTSTSSENPPESSAPSPNVILSLSSAMHAEYEPTGGLLGIAVADLVTMGEQDVDHLVPPLGVGPLPLRPHSAVEDGLEDEGSEQLGLVQHMPAEDAHDARHGLLQRLVSRMITAECSENIVLHPGVIAQLDGLQQPDLVVEAGVETADRGSGALHHLGDGHAVEAALPDERLRRIEDALERFVTAPLPAAACRSGPTRPCPSPTRLAIIRTPFH